MDKKERINHYNSINKIIPILKSKDQDIVMNNNIDEIIESNKINPVDLLNNDLSKNLKYSYF